MVHLRKTKQIQLHDSRSCKLYAYFEKAAFNSSFSKRDDNAILLDDEIGTLLRDFIKYNYHRATRVHSDPSKWKPSRHKLCALFVIYMTSRRHGNEWLWASMCNPSGNLVRVVRLMRTDSKVSHSLFSHLAPKTNEIDTNKLFACLLSQLSDVDIYPSNHVEHDNMELIKLIMERHTPSTWPIDILIYLDDDTVYETWEKLNKSKDNLRSWKNVLHEIPYPLKKYIKMIALFHKRNSQLLIRYASVPLNRLKCLKTLPPDWMSNLLTICTYCMECLTFVDINKRPSSFGHYIDGDTLTQRCHRDDSNRLTLMACFNPDKYVQLEIGHPDRHPATICQGRRSCFKIVSFADRLCPLCSDEMGLLDLHDKTCIGNGNTDLCVGCDMVKRGDGCIYDKIERERRESHVNLVHKKMKEVICRKDNDDKKRMRNQYRFKKAQNIKERQKLIK